MEHRVQTRLKLHTSPFRAIQPAQQRVASQEPVDDFAPGLFFLLLIACAAILICIGIIAIAIMVLLILFGLIGLGILSASVLVGLNKKSLASGFKTFLVSVSMIGGVILSSALCWILNEFQH